VGNIIYANDPHLLWVCDFDDVYLTHLGPRKKMKHHPCLLQNVVSGGYVVPHKHEGVKIFHQL
jgi:hypothetical protein